MLLESGLDNRRTPTGRRRSPVYLATSLEDKFAAKCTGGAQKASTKQNEGAGFRRGSCDSNVGEDEGIVVIVEVRAGERIQTGYGEIFHADVRSGKTRRESGEPTGVGGGIGVVVSIVAEGRRNASVVDGVIDLSCAVVGDDEDEIVAGI